ncbi:MAG: hypothetical protein CLLPBCKN_004675 [Chroococcidiopsis cubana SAG 39.79]|uniref:hypothetical protein n=1 Tax=Chroococcidiopsis cubana TaxID=171392 RepID=UPI002AC3F45D|nr:hypothetical protein [Chroococcidiopsis cubana]MDZ4875279.1 hypothetical protein [Chroococcidiopsis cubana SAG 39.79]
MIDIEILRTQAGKTSTSSHQGWSIALAIAATIWGVYVIVKEAVINYQLSVIREQGAEENNNQLPITNYQLPTNNVKINCKILVVYVTFIYINN